MNKSNHVDSTPTNNKTENSSMTTVNILGRLRLTTEQVRKIRSNLAENGNYHRTTEINLKKSLIDLFDKYLSSIKNQ